MVILQTVLFSVLATLKCTFSTTFVFSGPRAFDTCRQIKSNSNSINAGHSKKAKTNLLFR